MKRKPFCLVGTQQRLPLHQKHHRNSTIEAASIQESFHPSLRKDKDGILAGSACLIEQNKLLFTLDLVKEKLCELSCKSLKLGRHVELLSKEE
jgi:hypothetical protein